MSEYSTIVGSRDDHEAMVVRFVGGSNGMTLGIASTSVGGGLLQVLRQRTVWRWDL